MKFYLLVDDVFFSTRIKEVVRSANFECESLKKLEDVSKVAVDDIVFIDLAFKKFSYVEAIKTINPDAQKIGFAHHTDVNAIEEAKQAGVEEVLPRSQFVEMLPRIIKSIKEAGSESES